MKVIGGVVCRAVPPSSRGHPPCWSLSSVAGVLEPVASLEMAPPAASVNDDDEDKDEDKEITCAICLGHDSTPHLSLTGCTHRFHTECIHKLVHYNTKVMWAYNQTITNACIIKAVRACRCPTCSAPLSEKEVVDGLQFKLGNRLRADWHPKVARAFEIARVADASDANSPPEGSEGRAERVLPPVPSAESERAFRSWARKLHLKHCPHCQAPIEKIGGCRNMVCGNCAGTFRWDSVPLICTCKGYHLEWRDGPVPFWKACEHARRDEVALCHKAEFHAKRAVVLAPIVLVLAAPVLLTYSVVAAVDAVKKHRRRAARLRMKERTRRRLRAAEASFADENREELERAVACRRTGQHEWVAGWCHRCGALQEEDDEEADADVEPEAELVAALEAELVAEAQAEAFFVDGRGDSAGVSDAAAAEVGVCHECEGEDD